MGATDVEPTRLAAAPRRRSAFLDEDAGEVPRRRRRVSRPRVGRASRRRRTARSSAALRLAAARRGNGDSAMRSCSRRSSARRAADGRRSRAADGDPRSSPTARSMSGRTTPARGGTAGALVHVPVYAIVLGTQNGVVTVDAHRRLQSTASACRRTPRRCSRLSRSTGGEFFTAPRRRAADGGLREARLAARSPQAVARDHRRVRRRLRRAAARRGRAVGVLVPEGAVKRCSCSPSWRPRAAGAGRGSPPQATNECRGLMVCVPVAGPVGRRPGRAASAAARRWSTSSRVRVASSSAGSTRSSATVRSTSASSASSAALSIPV